MSTNGIRHRTTYPRINGAVWWHVDDGALECIALSHPRFGDCGHGNGNQGNILGKLLGFRPVGGSSVEYQDNVFIGVSIAEFFQENVQAFGSHIRQNQGDTRAIFWAGGGVGVGVLANDLLGNNRAVSLRSPVANGLADSSSPRSI